MNNTDNESTSRLIPSTAYRDVDGSSTVSPVSSYALNQGLETAFQQAQITVRSLTTFNGEPPDWSLCHPEAEFITLNTVPYFSRGNAATSAALAFLSCCDCCLFPLTCIYLMSAGNPLSLKVYVSSANSGHVCLKQSKYISKGQMRCQF